MITSAYNPDDRNAPATRLPRSQSLTIAESRASVFLDSNSQSRSGYHDANCTCSGSDVSDDDLITAAQYGDQQAFVELCGKYASMIKSKIFKIVRNQEDAEDALQDTLMRAYSHLKSFRRSCKFSTWLTTIGVNSALMILRKRRARGETWASTSISDAGAMEPHEPVDRSPGPEGIYLKQQAILFVRREIEKLKPSLRSVVRHYYGSDCSLEETARAQELTLAAAKSRLMRGRVRLRSSLSRYQISKSRN
jgi:RNA polymerase sigma-70 factor (ECF subfamily)